MVESWVANDRPERPVGRRARDARPVYDGAVKTASATTDRLFFVANGVVSAGALGLIGYLLLAHRATTTVDLSVMPAVNASFNALCAILLVLGRVAIAKDARRAHARLMGSAFAASACFFIGYLAYHALHGDTHYAGPARGLYLAILSSHVLLSMAVVPLAFAALFFALTGRFERHRRIAKVLFPPWLYVSVTGVVIYFFLR
jgi:putative membrane protein